MTEVARASADDPDRRRQRRKFLQAVGGAVLAVSTAGLLAGCTSVEQNGIAVNTSPAAPGNGSAGGSTGGSTATGSGSTGTGITNAGGSTAAPTGSPQGGGSSSSSGSGSVFHGFFG